MKLIIAGGRDFADFNLLKKEVDKLLSAFPGEDIEIVSGRARGADQLGEKYALERGYEIKYFPANWNKFGKRAGYLRNREMAEYGTHCITFWDGKSRGTKMMIEIAKEMNIPCKVIHIKNLIRMKI